MVGHPHASENNRCSWFSFSGDNVNSFNCFPIQRLHMSRRREMVIGHLVLPLSIGLVNWVMCFSLSYQRDWSCSLNKLVAFNCTAWSSRSNSCKTCKTRFKFCGVCGAEVGRFFLARDYMFSRSTIIFGFQTILQCFLIVCLLFACPLFRLLTGTASIWYLMVLLFSCLCYVTFSVPVVLTSDMICSVDRCAAQSCVLIRFI